VYRIALVQQKLREVRPVLSRDTGYKRCFHGFSIMLFRG
jgi:hypothetical protein